MGLHSGELAAVLMAIPGCALAWAGCLKLRRPLPASVAMVRFGLVRRVRPGAGRAAGALEGLAGGLLLVRPLSPWSYVLPIALLLLFVCVLARALSRHERFSCACFGSSARDVIGGATLARAAGLLGLCVAALVSLLAAEAPALPAATTALAVALGCLLAASSHLIWTIRSTAPFGD